MISVTQLTKKYGSQCVLDLPSLEIPKGQCFGLVGNNGAGKTTFFSLVLDLIKASSGSITIDGISVDRSESWKKLTAAYIDESFLIGYLSAEEYFYFVGRLRQQTPEQIDQWLHQFEPFFNGEVLKQKKYLRGLSKGNQKKVGIIATLIGQPQWVLLDEPFANLDPSSQIRLKKLILELREKQDITFLISSHDLNHVTEVCDRIVLMEKGLLIKDLKAGDSTLKELADYFTN